MLEFVDSDLYFVQDKNNFINPLLQVGSGSGSVEKITGSDPDPAGQKSPDPHPCIVHRKNPKQAQFQVKLGIYSSLIQMSR